MPTAESDMETDREKEMKEGKLCNERRLTEKAKEMASKEMAEFKDEYENHYNEFFTKTFTGGSNELKVCLNKLLKQLALVTGPKIITAH